MKKVSVVIPCYNASMYLHKCVDSLLHQTIGVENLEIILVDDASTDDRQTWKIIADYAEKYSETIIAVHLEENLRQGGARNVGVSHAGGEFLFFLDADDWLLSEALEHLYLAAIEQNADVVECLFKDVADFDYDDTEIEKGERDSFLIVLDTEEKRKSFLMEIDGNITLGTQKKLYRLSMIKENDIHFVKHLVCEEPSFMVLVRLYEKKHFFLNERLYMCFRHPDSTTTGDTTEHMWDNPKVWLYLVENLQRRDLFEKYALEIEYLFARWYLALTLQMCVQRGHIIQTEELQVLRDTVLQIFPNAFANPYLSRKNQRDTWNDFILKILDLEISEESVKVVNSLLRQALNIL